MSEVDKNGNAPLIEALHLMPKSGDAMEEAQEGVRSIGHLRL